MIKRGFLLPLLLCAGLFGPASASAQSSTPPASANSTGPNAAEARRVLQLLEDPQQRAKLIETLRTIAEAAPPTAPPPPAAPPTLAPEGLGAQMLSQVSSWADQVAGAAGSAAKAVADFPGRWGQAQRMAADPAVQAALATAVLQLVLVLGCGLVVEWLGRLALRRPGAVLAGAAPDNGAGLATIGAGAKPPANGAAWRLSRRLPFAFARLLLDLVPIALFAAAVNLLAAAVTDTTTRLAILTLAEAYIAYRVVLSVGGMLVSPKLARLRLWHIDDAAAESVMVWLRRITIVGASGGALAEIAGLLGAGQDAHNALVRLTGLIVAVLLGVIVLRSRRRVAAWLAAGAATPGGPLRWRAGFAGIWHYFALVLIAGGWIAWAAGRSGNATGLHVLLGTVAVLVIARLAAIVALGLLDRAIHLGAGWARRSPGLETRARRYAALTRAAVGALIAVLAGIALLQVWGAGALAWFEPGRVGGRLVSALVTIAVAVVAATVFWEAANAALERRLSRLSEAGPAAHAARLRTLLPMLRAALLSTILAIVGLTALSEIGVNIAPLLAGAGVAGVAIGFGAQKLVQDVITGMFVLFENAIQIGDLVTVAGLTGNVEQLSVRTIWLRSSEGAVHVIPFSAVTSITNASRGLGTATVSVTVAYKEDSDRVAEVLAEIAAGMRRDPEFAPLMLGDLKLLGVDAVKASGVTISAEVPCTPAGRWPVQREFNRRLQKRFLELGIELAGG